jgi:diacylglycerol kinase (ATP)
MKHNVFQKFGYALKGLLFAYKEEAHMRFHTLAAILTIAAGVYFPISSIEWILITLCIGLVLAVEMINSAIENLVDLAQPGHHPLAGKVKDIAAGAVLVTSIMAAIIGTVIFWPHICSILV